ncbi:MAG: hypothetical protein K0S91_919 [Nitrososphaeraceae archaeon]|nr:hypothetical protein [Nitrososphaeraceae archaeon]
MRIMSTFMANSLLDDSCCMVNYEKFEGRLSFMN